MEKVIIVDKKNKKIGEEEKLKAHQEGKLHRAFSIFIFNSRGELLLQKRAENKYHSGGLWSNTVCSHPRPNESLISAAHRRLKQEMGFDCMLKYVFKFHYRVSLDKSLIENEIDSIFIGKYEKEVLINKEEVSEFKWISLNDLQQDIILNQNKYTQWFKIILEKYIQKLFL
jgi:isopentenyl-diphosphate Delta-isomerase